MLFSLFNRGDDFVEVGPFAGVEFGMEQLAIGANFKSAAARRNERERFDAFAEFKNFGRQTDGLRRVVSNHAILDPDFGLHRSLLSKKTVRSWTQAVKRGRTDSVKTKRSARAVSENSINLHSTTRSAAGLTPNLKGEIDPAPDHSKIISRPIDHAKAEIIGPTNARGDAGFQANAKLADRSRVIPVVNGVSE